MTTYWSILERVKGSALRLTKMDDDIYNHLMETFPDFDPAETIDEDKMKSKTGKDKWRPFLMSYEKTVEDYNFGTMLRNSPGVEYEENNTIFGRPFCCHDPTMRTEILTKNSPPHAVLRHRDCAEPQGP